jgi:hypothetical protein
MFWLEGFLIRRRSRFLKIPLRWVQQWFIRRLERRLRGYEAPIYDPVTGKFSNPAW